MFKDLSHYFILQMLSKDSKKVTSEIYEKLSETGKKNIKIGDIPVAYLVKVEEQVNMKLTSLQNAIEDVASLKYVEFRNDIPVFEV